MTWSKAELTYLKDNYHKFSTLEIKQHLNDYFWNDRSIGSIRVKACYLGLKRFKTKQTYKK
jgi:hypothetical protein